MKKHPKAGKPMKITKGPLAGKYFVVIDWLTNQFQGKDVEKIAKAHPALVTPALRRNKMKKATNDLVFGSIYPTMNKMVVHDSEIILDDNKDNVVSLADKRKQKEQEDDTTGSSDGDSEDVEPGESDIDGCSLSSEELHPEDGGEGIEAGEADSDTGDSQGGTGEADDGKPKPKARTRKPAKGKAKQK